MTPKVQSHLHKSNFVEVKEPRASKLHRMDFFLKPKNMMKNIHCRTHFKAAISLSRGDPCCLKIQDGGHAAGEGDEADGGAALAQPVVHQVPDGGGQLPPDDGGHPGAPDQPLRVPLLLPALSSRQVLGLGVTAGIKQLLKRQLQFSTKVSIKSSIKHQQSTESTSTLTRSGSLSPS